VARLPLRDHGRHALAPGNPGRPGNRHPGGRIHGGTPEGPIAGPKDRFGVYSTQTGDGSGIDRGRHHVLAEAQRGFDLALEVH
jgi:hypothetical protein